VFGRDTRIPDPASLYVCRPRRRTHGAPAGSRTCSCSFRCPPIRHSGTAASTGQERP
jgi:hypothetical protein